MTRRGFAAWLATAALTAIATAQPQRPDFDATRLQQGAFRYRTIVDGKEAGQSRIEVMALPNEGRYRFSNVISGAFSQRWEAIATRTFDPISASLIFGEGTDTRPMFELAYRGGRVTGFALMRAQKPPARRAVDDPVAADTVDQRIDWAAVMAVPRHTAGDTFGFRVYDPETASSDVAVTVGEAERITVPAGAFDTVRVTYTIAKKRGAETYVASVRREMPRFLVRETFPNGSATELVEAVPPR